jgi:hypothetical protein
MSRFGASLGLHAAGPGLVPKQLKLIFSVRLDKKRRRLPLHRHLPKALSMDPIKAQMLLLKCRGNEIWNDETCQQEGIPESWIAELRDRFESGFDSDRNSIYVDGKLVNQYEGVSDLQIAYKLAEYLGINWQQVTNTAIGREAQVAALQAELDEI